MYIQSNKALLASEKQIYSLRIRKANLLASEKQSTRIINQTQAQVHYTPLILTTFIHLKKARKITKREKIT